MHRSALSGPATGASRVAFPCLLMVAFATFSAASAWAQETPQTVHPRKKPKAATPTVDLPPETPLALYEGGRVTFGEYQGWLRFLRVEDEVEKRSDRIAAIAINEVQAARARALGMQYGLTTRMARLDFENRLLHEALRTYLADSVELEPGELEREVEARQDAFGRPRRVRLYNILKRYPDGSDAAAIDAVRHEVESLRQQILDGADFATLAERESESQSRFRGGKIGWVRPGQLQPEVETVAMALEAGQLSEVLATGDGFTVLFCKEVEAAYQPPLDEIRQKVEKTLRQERFDGLWNDVLHPLDSLSLDLEAVRGEDGEAVAVRFDDTTSWTVAEVTAILQARGVRGLETLTTERIEQFLARPLELQVAADHARDLKLVPPGLREQLHWFEISTWTAALERQEIQRRFEPLKDEEIRAYYEAHRRRYRRPAQVHLMGLRLGADGQSLRQRFDQMETWAAELQAGRLDFEALARQYSEHASAARGGDLGWLDRKGMAALGPNILKTVETLQEGETSGLVQQPEGLTGRHSLWILKRLGQRPAKPLSFEEAKAAAENGLGTERTKTLQGQIRQEVLAELNLRPAGSSGAGD